jgi:peptide deformylase
MQLFKRSMEIAQTRNYFMTYELVKETDPILKQKCQEHIISEETKDLVYSMIVTMQEHDGIGLAAPQVGVAERVFVIGHRDTGYVVCINPKWEPTEDSEEELFLEGCLSFPHLQMKVKRHNKVRCEFTDVNGVRKTSEFVGVWAQAIQHEYDHLEGVTFDERAGSTALSIAKSKRREKLKRIGRKSKK